MPIFFYKMNCEERNEMITRSIHNFKGGFILLLFHRKAILLAKGKPLSIGKLRVRCEGCRWGCRVGKN